MSSEQIYLAARDCATGDKLRDLTSPISWRGTPSFLDKVRAFASRSDAKAAARAAEERTS